MTATSAAPDRPLLLRAADLGASLDGRVCAALVAQHGPMVKAVCARILRDAALAEDAAQEVFVLFVRKATTLPAETILSGWFYQTAGHIARTHGRTRARRHVRETQPEALENLMPSEPSSVWLELEPLLDDAMLTLPERQRSLVLLCYFQKFSQCAAARAVGCSESVVSRDLAAAIEALRGFFARRGVTVAGPALIALLGAHAAQGVIGAAAIVAAMAFTGVVITSTASATTFMQTTTILKLGAAAAALALGGYAAVHVIEPAPPVAVQPPATIAPAAPAPPPPSIASASVSIPKEPARKNVTRVEWSTRFRPLFGLPKPELLQRLAEMGFPLRERTLDLLLKNARTPEEFTAALTEHLMLFHPDRLIADAINAGVEPNKVAALRDDVRRTWKRKKLENWMPTRGLVELMREHFGGEEKLVAELKGVTRPYGSPLDVDPLAKGAQLLAIPAAERRENQVMELALDWPAERAHEMAVWGLANLEGKERKDFFTRLAYPAYASGNPDLAVQLIDSLTDPELYALAAPMAALTLTQHDRPEEALVIMEKLDGSARNETAKLIGKHWALRDPDGAIAWLNDLKGAAFDAALGGMFEHLPPVTMRTALAQFASGPLESGQELAILRGLSRTTSWTDVATASEVIPGYFAARGNTPLAAPRTEDWKGTPQQQIGALRFDVAARTVWSLSQKQNAQAALAWSEGVPWASPQDKLIAQAYALPETVEIYQRNSVLGPIRGWINQQLAEPAKRQALETRLAHMRAGGK